MRPALWWRRLTPAVVAGFAAVVLVLAGTLIAELRTLRDVHATSEAVRRVFALKVELRDLLASLVDAETGQRGYVITGDRAYLEPYEHARREMGRELARLRSMTGDREGQREVDELSVQSAAKLDELAEVLRRYDEGGLAAAQAGVRTNLDRRTMDRMRGVVARMEARQDAALADRTRQAARSYLIARVLRVAMTGVALLAIAGLFVLTLHQATRRLEATRAAEAHAAELADAVRQRDDFVAAVSHDLRTPMNTVVGWARMLEQGTIRPEREHQAIASIYQNAEAMRHLLDDLTDTTQLVSGRMRLAIDAVDLRQVVEESVETVQWSAESKGVAIVQYVEPALPVIRGDADRLRQAVWNLLSNAIKFTPTAGEIAITVTGTPSHLRLEVRDSGDGIDPAFLPFVFERYRQAPGNAGRHRRSLGLGLAIVRSVVELHGGRVSAQSAGLGQGATFTIELPIASAVMAPQPRPAESARV